MTILRRWWVISGLVLLLLVGLVAFGAPRLVAQQLREFLLAQGAQQVAIGGIDLNPLAGEITLSDLHAADAQGLSLAVGTLTMDIGIGELFDGRVAVQSLTLSGGHLDLRRNPLRLGPLRLPADDAEGGSAWLLGVTRVQVEDFTVADPALGPPIEIDELIAEHAYAWDPDRPTTARVQLAQDAARVRIEGTLTPFAERFEFRGSIEAAAVAFAGAAPEASRLALGELQAAGVHLTPERVHIQALTINDLDGRLLRSADGVWALPGPAGAAGEPTDAPTDAQSSFAAQIDRLEITGDSTLALRDLAVTPAVELSVQVDQLVLQDIGSDSSRPVTLDAAFSIGDVATLALTGTGMPLAAEPSAQVSAQLAEFDLTQVSSYVAGYDIERGRLSVDGEYQLAGGQLDLLNAVVIDKLKLSASDNGEVDDASGGSDMPLDVMLSLLRDGEDRIAIDLPISGSLDDPQIGTGALLRRATQNALKRTAMNYAKGALQPFGSILFAADLVGKAARPRFDPMTFAAGSAEIGTDQLEYAEKLAALLAARPGLSLTICGVATDADAEQVATDADAEQVGRDEEALHALAKQRADALRARLSGEVAAQRLFECLPQVESGADGEPRVDVSL